MTDEELFCSICAAPRPENSPKEKWSCCGEEKEFPHDQGCNCHLCRQDAVWKKKEQEQKECYKGGHFNGNRYVPCQYAKCPQCLAVQQPEQKRKEVPEKFNDRNCAFETFESLALKINEIIGFLKTFKEK